MCNQFFGAPKSVWHPQSKGWYWPKTQEPQCPRCLALLRDKRAFSIKTGWGVAYLVGIVALLVVPMGQAIRITSALSFAIIFFILYHRFRAKVPDQERYAARDD
jgi:uncharacterized paraquat-inducible protein A